MTKLRVLLYDIESGPLLAHIWHPTDQYVTHDRLIHDSFLLTWSAKWLGEKTITSGCVTPQEAIDQNDSRIVFELAEMIREADVVVAHNGDRFDIPMLNNRLLVLGLTPIGPKRSIDTCKLAKRNFRLAYNKLDYLGEILGLGKKLKTDFQLWKSCYHGDQTALNKMLKYNRRDVVLLEQVYEALMPYVTGTPRLVIPEFDGQHVCPHCGSEHLMKRGFHHTNVSHFQKWSCSDCTKYSRSRKSEPQHFSVAPL